MRIATITPVRNDATALGSAVASILAQHEVHIDKVVIAVGPSDDDSDDSHVVADQLASNETRIVVIHNPSGRTPDALNLAIDAAGDVDVIVRVDARAIIPPTYVRDAIETLERTGAGNVGAIQNPVGQTPTERAIAAAMKSPLGTGGVAYRGATEAQQVDTAWLGVFRRAALVEVGGYDSDFNRNQDAELNIRLQKAGHDVWLDPRLVVDYRPRSSIAGLAKQYRQYGWWRLRTIRKHPGSLSPRQLAAPLLVAGLAAAVIAAALWSPFALVPAIGYVAGLTVGGLCTEGPVQQRLLAALALGVMHISWGTGFWLSLLSLPFVRSSAQSDATRSV